ncbi:MAG: hypothetical protein RL186_108 [Pseudomonadota bacterium]
MPFLIPKIWRRLYASHLASKRIETGRPNCTLDGHGRSLFIVKMGMLKLMKDKLLKNIQKMAD